MAGSRRTHHALTLDARRQQVFERVEAAKEADDATLGSALAQVAKEFDRPVSVIGSDYYHHRREVLGIRGRRRSFKRQMTGDDAAHDASHTTYDRQAVLDALDAVEYALTASRVRVDDLELALRKAGVLRLSRGRD